MASKSTNASDRTQKASKSKRKSSRRMKKSTNTPDTTQKASKSKKKDVRYQSLGTVPIFGEMNNKRSMRQEHIQKADKSQASGHSNYDVDEIVRHSNLSAAVSGVDRILYTSEQLSEQKDDAMKNKHDSRFCDADKAIYDRIVGAMTGDAKKIYELIQTTDFALPIGPELTAYKNEK
eukprot:943025_1